MGRALNDPLVSVVIPNWNGKQLLSTCLRSLEHLTYPNYEVIVVDNGSTDGSGEMLRTDFPSVKLVVSPTNVGFAAGCNLGIRIARGDIIAIFNNDASAESSWLSKLVACVLKEDDLGIAGGLILYEKPAEHVWSAGMRIDAVTGTSWRLEHLKPIHSVKPTEDIDFLSFCGVAFRRRLLDEIGLLNENYFVYGEDLDWTLNARRAGHKCKLDYSAVVWHAGSSTSRRDPGRRYYYFMRGRFRTYFKHFPLRFIVTSLFFQLTLFPVVEVLVFRASPLLVLRRLEAFVWNLRRLKVVMAERKGTSSLGPLTLKNRFAEFLQVAREHIASNYYEF